MMTNSVLLVTGQNFSEHAVSNFALAHVQCMFAVAVH